MEKIKSRAPSQKSKGGRPVFKPTPAMRSKVQAGAAVGMSALDIAGVIGCTEPTLRKHFQQDLDTGRCSARIEAIETLRNMCSAGNVTAARAMAALTDDYAPRPALHVPRVVVQEAKLEPMGKKERANKAAREGLAEAGTSWEEIMRESEIPDLPN